MRRWLVSYFYHHPDCAGFVGGVYARNSSEAFALAEQFRQSPLWTFLVEERIYP